VKPEEWEQVKSRFDAALKHEGDSRARYLDDACGGDADLRAEVQSLVAAYEDADSLIDRPAMSAGPEANRSAGAMTNRSIGPYRIERLVGRGGMADVYLAMRADRLYQRSVAIKIVTGLDSEEVLRRFRREGQTLAVLDHPNIVKLLDAGTTDEGFPYLVMDYVQGQPIDQYCDSRNLSVVERLELFRRVCAAVHYAHLNLVVHRDLKPNNILVTAEGEPKLLDFGIAKLTKPEYSPDTMGLTRPGLRLMTAEYASPEQVKGEPISPASDVYSLGVLLYRLLTGRRPYGVKNHSALEYQRAICQTEPEKPSAVVAREKEPSHVPDGVPARLVPALLGSTRDGTPGTPRQTPHADLDAIVLMAMRKEPQRRYQSAEQFSEDIRRHLASLPVIACKQTVCYRSAKFIRRHKARVATAAVVAVLLAWGILAGYVAGSHSGHLTTTSQAAARNP
jgi:serine/threonine protein kinase